MNRVLSGRPCGRARPPHHRKVWKITPVAQLRQIIETTGHACRTAGQSACLLVHRFMAADNLDGKPPEVNKFLSRSILTVEAGSLPTHSPAGACI